MTDSEKTLARINRIQASLTAINLELKNRNGPTPKLELMKQRATLIEEKENLQIEYRRAKAREQRGHEFNIRHSYDAFNTALSSLVDANRSILAALNAIRSDVAIIRRQTEFNSTGGMGWGLKTETKTESTTG